MAANNKKQMDLSEVSRRAVAIAKENGEVFDYSPESISALDRLFMGQVMRFKRREITLEYLWNISVIFGVYLGQSMLFNGLADKGYRWMPDEEDIPLLYDGGDNYVSPLRHLFLYAQGKQDYNARTLFESVLNLAYGDLGDAVIDQIPQ